MYIIMSLLYVLNVALATGGLLLLGITLALVVDYLRFGSRYYVRFVVPYVWLVLPLVTVGSVAMSLLYSEYFGFIPCSLCWLQRIALYPQALFSLMAYKTKEAVFYPLYGIGLSIFGLVVAVYHYIYQLLPKEVITGGFMPCLADGSSDCAELIMQVYGFVTFPFLSAVTFAFLIVIYLNLRRSASRS